MIDRLTLPMKLITEVRENIVCFSRLRTSISPLLRGSTPRNGDRKRVSQEQGKGRKDGREANEFSLYKPARICAHSL